MTRRPHQLTTVTVGDESTHTQDNDGTIGHADLTVADTENVNAIDTEVATLAARLPLLAPGCDIVRIARDAEVGVGEVGSEAVDDALLGIVVGIFFGVTVTAALETQGINVLSIPALQIFGLVIFAVIAGLLAAIIPARRAANLNVLEAIAYE